MGFEKRSFAIYKDYPVMCQYLSQNDKFVKYVSARASQKLLYQPVRSISQINQSGGVETTATTKKHFAQDQNLQTHMLDRDSYEFFKNPLSITVQRHEFVQEHENIIIRAKQSNKTPECIMREWFNLISISSSCAFIHLLKMPSHLKRILTTQGNEKYTDSDISTHETFSHQTCLSEEMTNILSLPVTFLEFTYRINVWMKSFETFTTQQIIGKRTRTNAPHPLGLRVAVLLSPSVDTAVVLLGLQALGHAVILLEKHDTLSHIPLNTTSNYWLWRHCIVESKADLCITDPGYVALLSPLLKKLAIPSGIFLSEISQIISEQTFLVALRQGKVRVTSVLEKAYIFFRSNYKQEERNYEALIDKQDNGCSFRTVDPSLTPGILLFTDTELSVSVPIPVWQSLENVMINAQRFINTFALKHTDNIFCCLPTSHPGCVVDAIQGGVGLGAKLYFAEMLNSEERFTPWLHIWNQLSSYNRAGYPITVIQMTDVQARHLLEIFWSEELTETKRSRYKDAANQIRLCFIYKTASEIVSCSFENKSSLPDIIQTAMKRHFEKVTQKRNRRCHERRLVKPIHTQKLSSEEEKSQILRMRQKSFKIKTQWSLLVHPDGKVIDLLAFPQIGTALFSHFDQVFKAGQEPLYRNGTKSMLKTDSDKASQVVDQESISGLEVWGTLSGVQARFDNVAQHLYLRTAAGECPTGYIGHGIVLNPVDDNGSNIQENKIQTRIIITGNGVPYEYSNLDTDPKFNVLGKMLAPLFEGESRDVNSQGKEKPQQKSQQQEQLQLQQLQKEQDERQMEQQMRLENIKKHNAMYQNRQDIIEPVPEPSESPFPRPPPINVEDSTLGISKAVESMLRESYPNLNTDAQLQLEPNAMNEINDSVQYPHHNFLYQQPVAMNPFPTFSVSNIYPLSYVFHPSYSGAPNARLRRPA